MAYIKVGQGVILGEGIKVGRWNTLPTGGAVTTSGIYTIHTFTSSGIFLMPPVSIGPVDILLVGAGGGSTSGGVNGAGGGGGVVYKSAYTLYPGSYIVTVGQGRAVGYGDSGENTSIVDGSFSLVALGGGYGGFGTTFTAGGNGGSGGGGRHTNASGGSALQPSSASGGYGGNGGAGGNFLTSGRGGGASGTTIDGVAFDISGTMTYYGGGGGRGRGYGQSAGGAGGLGGGGDGADGPSGTYPTAGAPNTGGGAGGQGGTYQHLPGGSGIVIIRYVT